MRRLIKVVRVFLFICPFIVEKLYGQTELLSEIDLLQMKRLHSFRNHIYKDSISSQMLYLGSNAFDIDSGSILIKYKGVQLYLYRIGMAYQLNTHIGKSINDGAFLPNVGIQKRKNFNLALNWKGISVKFAPEWIYTENRLPTSFELDQGDGNYMARYYMYIVNKIDMYPRFGDSSLKRFNLGQSSVKYNYKNFQIGVSSENLWWGPSIRNALIMSNNAQGFPHLSLNTYKPVVTSLGSFESQVIYGQLSNVKFDFPDNPRMRSIWEGGIAQKKELIRSIYGYTFNWQPKWTKNLFIGVAMTNQRYLDFADTLGFVAPKFLKNNKLKLGSFFMRYAMPQDQTELYVEIGRADKLANPINVFKDQIPLGYTAGIRKLVNLSRGKSNLYFGLEVTRLQLPDPRLIFREEGTFGPPKTHSWYTSDSIRQGYTNYGEVMGAYIGPGSNSQLLQVGWLQGMRKIMLIGERLQHNNDFYYYNYFNGNTSSAVATNNRYWVDISAGIQVQWPIGNFLLSSMYKYTSVLNYRWIKLDGGFSGRSVLSDRKTDTWTLAVYWFLSRGYLGNPNKHPIKIKDYLRKQIKYSNRSI